MVSIFGELIFVSSLQMSLDLDDVMLIIISLIGVHDVEVTSAFLQ